MKNLIKILLSPVFILASTMLYAQEADENWEEIHREDQVIFWVQHNASRITKTVNTVVKVQNLNKHKVFIQFTPLFYCNGENTAPKQLDTESTYLGVGKDDSTSLHAFQVCTTGQLPIVKIEGLSIGETDELDAAKRIKHEK